MEMKLYTLKTRSGLHCGIGQGLSDIDLPTARESVSGYPLVPGSSIKGVLRDHFDDGSARFLAAFGQPSDAGTLDFASAVSFTDARLICLPVRSYFGTFAHMASPYSLGILRGMLIQAGQTDVPGLPDYPPGETDSYRASIPEGSKLVSFGRLADRVLLEDLDLLVDDASQALAGQWARRLAVLLHPADEENRRRFAERFVIVDDNVMAFFCETALPVATHVKIGANGVAQGGALWLEEFVPPEAVFAGSIFAEKGKGAKNQAFSAADMIDFVTAEPIDGQVGGGATTGRGQVSIAFK